VSIKVLLNGAVDAGVTEASLQELKLDFSFDNFSPNFELLEDWLAEFVDRGNGESGNSVSFVNDWIASRGVYNNIPAQVVDEKTGTVMMDGYVDLTDPQNQYDDLKCIYKLAVKNRISSFAELIEGLNLRELVGSSALVGDSRITASDYQNLKYIRSQVPDYGTAAMLNITLYLLGIQLVDQITTLTELLTKGYTIPAYITSAAGAALWWGIELAKTIAITAFLVIAIVRLLRDISDLIFSKPTPVWTVGVKTLFEKGCKALGYTFESTLFDGDYSDLRYLAAFNYDESTDGKRRVTSPENNPVPNITLGKLFENFSKVFNAKTRITDDKRVIFENRDFFIKNPFNYSLPALKNNGTYTYNLSELPRSLKIKFSDDPIEKNTLLNIKMLGIKTITNTTSSKGDQITVTYDVTGVSDSDLTGLKETIDVEIPMARAYRKTQQTHIEQVFNGIWDIAQRIVGNNNNKIGDRIGYMLLDSNYLGTDKILIQDGDKISQKNFDLIHAETLYSDFWSVESPATNQWKIYTNRDRQPICDLSIFTAIKDNNVIYNDKGKVILIQQNIYDPMASMHEFTFRQILDSSDAGYIPESQIVETIITDEDQ